MAASICSRETQIGKALFLYKRNDDTTDDRLVKIMERMKTELDRKGIRVTNNEDDDQCHVAIMFVTKGFLFDRYHYIRKKFKSRFIDGHCSMIICDDNDGKFADFIKYCVYESVRYGDEEDRAREIPGYEVTVLDVDRCIGNLMVSSKPKHRVIIPGVSPATENDIEAFAVAFAEEAALAFNPMRLDYDNIHPGLESDTRAIYKNLLLNDLNKIRLGGSDDVLFTVFVGCPCGCFDTTTISKLISNLNFLTHREFDNHLVISKEKFHDDIHNDPHALRKAFLLVKYRPRWGLAENLKFHLKREDHKLKYLILIEDFKLSGDTLALNQLSNLCGMIGSGSLVIITTSSSTQLFDKMDLHKIMQGTTCSNDTNFMVKCYTILKSTLLEPLKETSKSLEALKETEDVQMTISDNDTWDKEYIESSHIAQFESSTKKLKTTLLLGACCRILNPEFALCFG